LIRPPRGNAVVPLAELRQARCMLNIPFRHGSGHLGFKSWGVKECVMSLIPNLLAIIGLVRFTVGVAPSSARAEQRIDLVLGNAAYEHGALKTLANDAVLIAQTLEAAGFDVIGARDLDNDALRRAIRDFVDKAAAVGPDGVAVLYLGGYGLQLVGENYFLPGEARLERASDSPGHAVRVSEYTRALASLEETTS